MAEDDDQSANIHNERKTSRHPPFSFGHIRRTANSIYLEITTLTRNPRLKGWERQGLIAAPFSIALSGKRKETRRQ